MAPLDNSRSRALALMLAAVAALGLVLIAVAVQPADAAAQQPRKPAGKKASTKRATCATRARKRQSGARAAVRACLRSKRLRARRPARSGRPVGASTGARSADPSALSWAPPALTAPTTLDVTDETSRNLTLDTEKDYVLRLGRITKPHGLRITGGRNVVIIGGHITIPEQDSSASIDARRGILIYGSSGVVHIEGVLIDGPALTEGIQIGTSPGGALATVQIQNVRIDGVHARDEVNFSDSHPDCIQPWGGARAIRVDRFTCSTDGSAMYFDSNDAKRLCDCTTGIGEVDIRRFNAKKQPKSSAYGTGHKPWLFQRVTDDGDMPMRLSDFWLEPLPGDSLSSSVGVEPWENSRYQHLAPSLNDGGTTASWPQDAQLSGSIRRGVPPTGDFVPPGTAGTGYVSPGYR